LIHFLTFSHWLAADKEKVPRPSIPELVYKFRPILDRKVFTVFLPLCFGPIAPCAMQIAAVHYIDAGD
jgi:hypothetical protein